MLDSEILFLSPYQGLPVVSFGHAGLIKTLNDMNFKITTLICDGMLVDACAVSISMQKDNLSKVEKKNFCSWCRSYSKQFKKLTPGKIVYLDKFLQIEHKKKISSIISKITPKCVKDFEIDGIPVGRISAYNFILCNKVFDIESCDFEQFEIYRNHLSACLHAYYSFKSFIDREHSRFSHIFINNTMYAIHNIIRHISNKYEINTVHLDVGYHYNYVHESWRFSHLSDNKVLRSYNLDFFEKNRQSLLFNDESNKRLLEFADTHWNKKNNRVYSVAASRDLKSLKKRLKLTDRFKKVVLIATSSDDETYAYEFVKNINSKKSYRLFQSQEKWLDACIEYFRNKTNTFVILRIHPREFIKFKSASSQKMIDKFSSFPDNIFLNTPDQNISLYDLLNLLDLVLVNISTTGVEAGLVGLPTISSNDRIYYPIDHKGESFENADTYFEAVEKILSERQTRKLRYLQTSMEWIMYTGVQTNLNFDNGDYFKKYPKKDIISRYIKTFKKTLNLPALDLKTYLNHFHVREGEKNMIHDFLVNRTEIVDYHHITPCSDSWSMNSDINPKDILINLLKIFINLDYSVGKELDQLMSMKLQGNKTVKFFVDELSKC